MTLTITNIKRPGSDRPESVTLDGGVPLELALSSETWAVAFDAATISAAIGSDTIVLPRANGELKAGMLVSGTGIPAGTVIESVTTAKSSVSGWAKTRAATWSRPPVRTCATGTFGG